MFLVGNPLTQGSRHFFLGRVLKSITFYPWTRFLLVCLIISVRSSVASFVSVLDVVCGNNGLVRYVYLFIRQLRCFNSVCPGCLRTHRF